jgi:hypothetical protein
MKPKIILLVGVLLFCSLANAKAINETQINNLAFEISMAKNYTKDVYDCTQYAREMNRQLRKENYKSYCVFGKMYGEYHNWVVIREKGKDTFIEATQGNDIGIINPEFYKQGYIELRRGKCQ